jgi:hypothetical protein
MIARVVQGGSLGEEFVNGHCVARLPRHQKRQILPHPDEGISDQPQRMQHHGEGETDEGCLAEHDEVKPAGVFMHIDGRPAARRITRSQIVDDR